MLDVATGVARMVGARHDGAGACLCKFTRSGLRTPRGGCPKRAHIGCLRALAVSPGGQLIATGGDDRAVVVWDAPTGGATLRLQGHTRRVNCVSFSNTGGLLASGSCDGHVLLWNTVTGALQTMITDAQDGAAVSTVQFCPVNNERLLTHSHTGHFNEWRLGPGESELAARGIGHLFAVYSPDGMSVATVRVGDYGVCMVNLHTAAFIRYAEWNPVDRRVDCIAFDVDGKLATGHFSGSCSVWDVSNGDLLLRAEGRGGVRSVCCGRDWALDVEMDEAFVMGHHPRLGAGSLVFGLDEQLLRLIPGREPGAAV
jgi:WD40 repeat protein